MSQAHLSSHILSASASTISDKDLLVQDLESSLNQQPLWAEGIIVEATTRFAKHGDILACFYYQGAHIWSDKSRERIRWYWMLVMRQGQISPMLQIIGRVFLLLHHGLSSWDKEMHPFMHHDGLFQLFTRLFYKGRNARNGW